MRTVFVHLKMYLVFDFDVPGIRFERHVEFYMRNKSEQTTVE